MPTARYLEVYEFCFHPLDNVLIVPINYNSAGSMKTVINSYEDIFYHSDKVGCVLNSCQLMTAGACGTPLPPQTDIVLGPSPTFSITASELIP